jgi:hypothetical protein
VLDLQPHRARAGTLAQHHVQREVLHGRVQDLLHRVAQPVDLVDEQHVALAQRGEHRGQVAGALDGRTGGGADLRPHLGGHDVGQRRLAQPRRAVEQDVVDRLIALPRRVDQDRQVLLDPILPGELIQPSRPDAGLQDQLVLGDLRAGHPLDRHQRRLPASESNM